MVQTMEMNQPPKSLGQVARRISAWTTNSLITFMLLVVALGFGREVLHWWHDGPARAVPSVPVDPLGDVAAPHVLEFGDQAWSMRRETFSGRQGDVPAALERACRAAIVDSRPPRESADAAEDELLKRLADERPVAEEPGQWRLYRWGEGHPVLIGTRAFPAGTNLDETTYRVVIWGIAVPAGPDAWTLCLFQSGGAGHHVPVVGGQGQPEVEIPLPPGGHRLVSIRAVGGGAITAFSVDHEHMVPNGNAARGFYDRWFADHGWTVADGWRETASGWHARFEARSQAPAPAADIRLGLDSQGRWSGLVMESGQ
jgi:hypothetical protein